MRNAIFVALSSILILILAIFAFGAISEEAGASASITVNTFVDITIADRGAGGINFGSLDPGTTDNKEVAQNGLGAINFSVEKTTNINPVNVKLRGNNFNETGGITIIDISNAIADDDNILTSGNITLSTTFKILKTLAPDTDTEIYFFLDVPTAQKAASYSSTFYFQGD